MKGISRYLRAMLVYPIWVCVVLCPAFTWATTGDEGHRLEDLSLSDLLKQRSELHHQSTTSSPTPESLRDAPAALIIIDEEDIKRRGYDSIDDLFADLPGFDVTVTNGTEYTVAYQRGYRTPWTQRTLFLIDGRVDNDLWMHGATLSRQYPMSHIARVEIMYGPGASVYGPNAFLGVINIITKKGSALLNGESQLEATVEAGSFNTQALDLSYRGNYDSIRLSLGLRWFKSDEPHIRDYSYWGYTDESLLSNPEYWGAGIGGAYDPADPTRYSPPGDLNVDGTVSSSEEISGTPLGYYTDPSENRGLFANIAWKDWELGLQSWKTAEGYGPYYSFADGQSNGGWVRTSDQLYINNTLQPSKKFHIASDLVYRENTFGGLWIESFANHVSISDWISSNKALRFEQDYRYNFSKHLNLSAGLKFARKELSRRYVICNYWDGLGFCPAQADNSTNGLSSDGTGVAEANTISSLNPMQLPPYLNDDILAHNRLKTRDTGAYIQAAYDVNRWRFNTGVRWDNHNIYGSEINPRGAAIFHYSPTTTYKLVYGEAYQEPSTKDLYGNWNGRETNDSLLPEKVRNLEFITLYQTKYLLHDFSLFRSQYENAITSSANVGDRDISGFEYRGEYRIPNAFYEVQDITGNFYYTYTKAVADQQYNNVLGEWVEQHGEQGDIAPHKISWALNAPLSKHWNVNLRVNWVAERALFSQNPLRADSNPARETNRNAEAYTKVNLNILYTYDHLQFGLKVENLLEEDYLSPGPESASTGDDFSQDYDGFQNSLVPQVNQRSFTLHMRVAL